MDGKHVYCTCWMTNICHVRALLFQPIKSRVRKFNRRSEGRGHVYLKKIKIKNKKIAFLKTFLISVVMFTLAIDDKR